MTQILNYLLNIKQKEKMRRSKILNNTIFLLLFLAAFFNILSFAMDQIVVQTEDKIRQSNYNLSQNRIKLTTILNARNNLEEINEDINLESMKMISVYEFSQKKYSLFGKSENFFKENKMSYLLTNKGKNINFYFSQMKEVIQIYNQKTDQINLIIKKSFNTEYFKQLFKENIFYKKIIKGEYFEKIPTNTLDGYENKNEDDRYIVYSSIQDKLKSLSGAGDEIEYLQERLEFEYKKNYAQYIEFLNQYGEQKNINNFIIIISILFQIIGVTFLLLLFKVLIKENY